MENSEKIKTERPWHHLPNGRFRNPPGSPIRPKAGFRKSGFLWEMLRTSFGKTVIPEDHVLERGMATRLMQDHILSRDSFLTWLGHASFLFRVGGKTVLTDPYLTKYAGPSGLGPKRFVRSGIAIADLPPVDILVVSHNHYDHLDERALARLPGKERITVVVPLRLGSFFRRRGFLKVIELDWHESHTLDGLTITALPVIHWSRRSGWDMNRTLWAGFAFKSSDHHLFFGGDSAFGDVFRETGKRYGPFDTALVGIGAYAPRPIMVASHATPEEAVRIGKDIGARRLVGMHWGTVILTSEPPFEPPRRFLAAGKVQGYGEEDLWIMKIGETRPLLPSSWPANT